MPLYTDHMGLAITTSSAVAAVRYADGVELLVVASPKASAMLKAAVDADPALAVARAALAWVCGCQAGADAELLDALAATTAGASSGTRRERQLVEIVIAALRGNRERARALGSEHVREFPGDVFVAHVIRQLSPIGD